MQPTGCPPRLCPRSPTPAPAWASESSARLGASPRDQNGPGGIRTLGLSLARRLSRRTTGQTFLAPYRRLAPAGALCGASLAVGETIVGGDRRRQPPRLGAALE